ncbi:hypothetical protein B7P43_G05316 [Cryptotermes secundus]|uniref:DUF4766 domain-containing protein n=1 Tax=Cryptotermes secundus TaxID=105785 RepID=A0A2J7QF97_9NEOP|nr:uncharacterized protein LOC111867930 isoform X3 [Cryptotermes secundus]PNF27262.1 hypothetical protein B7P43_G05316 [Cryptotermes secundus]
MEFSGFSFCVSFMLIAFSAVAKAIQVSPKVDFGDTSPGINPDDIKVFIEKEKTSVNPGVVKAVLEVKVGESIVTDKYPAKSDKKEHKNTTKTNILICSLEGDCKLHEFNTDLSEDDEKEGDTKELKPIIVTDFDEDPLKGNNDDDDHNDGKKNPNIPVIVGYRGAVKDDGFYYTGHSNGQGIDRLPTYYGTTLRPGFHQPYPGPNIYGEVPRPPPPPRPGFNYGYGPRTPSPYGHLHPTRKPGSFHAIITPLGRGNGVGGLDTPTVRGIVAVHGKVDFDEDDINVGVIGPLYPSSGNGNVKVDGKLGEPLHKSDP